MSRLLNYNGVWLKDHTTGYYFDGGHGYHPDTRDAFFIRGGAPGSHGAHDTIICGNDGGVSKTNNGIDAWNNLNGTGLWANEFWDIGLGYRYYGDESILDWRRNNSYRCLCK
jgi:hypothetical protein